ACCLRALAKKPAERYPSMKAFAVALNPPAASPIPPPHELAGQLPVLRLSPIEDVTLEPGQTSVLEVRVRRQQCRGPIELRLEGLPPQVQAGRGLISAEEEHGGLRLRAGERAAAGPLTARLLAIAADTQVETAVHVIVRGTPLPREITNSIGMK